MPDFTSKSKILCWIDFICAKRVYALNEQCNQRESTIVELPLIYQDGAEANGRQREEVSVRVHHVIIDLSYRAIDWSKTMYSRVT